MNRFCSPRLAILVVLVAIGLAPGCGKKLPPMTPVSGKVTVDGQPVTAGQVSLVSDVGMPTQEKKTEGQDSTLAVGPSVGQIGSDGTYKVFTSGKEGAPLGKYKVTVTPPMMPSADNKAPAGNYSRKYSDSKNTPLKIEVIANAPPGAYDLKLTK
jgi:hypothetical protein